MKKTLLLVFVFILLAGSASALTLRTVSTFSGADAAADTYLQLLSEWEEMTGHSVSDMSSPSSESWKSSVLMDFAAGNEPDVLFYFSGTADNAPILRKVVRIDEINAAYPEAQLTEDDICREADGHIYAIPIRAYWEGLLCNTDVFEAYDVPLPTNWQELLDAIEIFRANGIVPIAAALGDVPHYVVEFCILGCGSRAEHEVRPQTADDVPPSWIGGMELLRDLYDLGAFPEDTCSITENVAADLFIEKKAAMILDGSWFANGLPYENMSTTVVLPFPSVNGDRPVAFRGTSMGFYLSRRAWDNTEKRDAAVSLLSWLSTGENARRLGGYIYTDSLLTSAETMLHGNAVVTQPLQDSMSQDARTLWFESIPDVVEGRITPEQLWNDIMALHPFN